MRDLKMRGEQNIVKIEIILILKLPSSCLVVNTSHTHSNFQEFNNALIIEQFFLSNISIN